MWSPLSLEKRKFSYIYRQCVFGPCAGWLAGCPVCWLPSTPIACVLQRKPNKCFNAGHEQIVRTVRASADGKSFECVASGEVQSGKNDAFKFYFRLKPGSVREYGSRCYRGPPLSLVSCCGDRVVEYRLCCLSSFVFAVGTVYPVHRGCRISLGLDRNTYLRARFKTAFACKLWSVFLLVSLTPPETSFLICFLFYFLCLRTSTE